MNDVAAEALEARFARESEEINLRRARVMIALVLVVHVGVVVFGTAPAGELEASERAWFDMLVLSHEVMCGVAGTLLALCLLPGRVLGLAHKSVIGPVVGELTYAAYLAMGVASSLNDQRQFASNINAYVIAVLVPPLVFRLRFAPVVVLQAIAMTIFLVLLPSVQPSEAARLSVMVIVPIMGLLGMGLSYVLTDFARKEVANRLALEAQRAEIERKNDQLEKNKDALEALNASLEKRVAEQVEEIVARAKEVDVLNAQLMERVQERSRELSSALARLARASGKDSGVLAPGARLGGRVRIESVIGQGGMGVVYRGHDSVTDLPVAVKVVQAASAAELDNLHRFLQEARAAASVQHPAIVRTLHIDVSDDGELFQIQELVVGKPLDRVLADGRALSPAVVCRLGAALADALAAAHASKVVHRDVKPANILLTETGAGLKLLDFGISKMREARGEHATLTKEGLVVGTPAFMAPRADHGARSRRRSHRRVRRRPRRLPRARGSLALRRDERVSLARRAGDGGSRAARLARALAARGADRPGPPRALEERGRPPHRPRARRGSARDRRWARGGAADGARARHRRPATARRARRGDQHDGDP
jgi:cell division protein FtsB